jgi:hypothetical protein
MSGCGIRASGVQAESKLKQYFFILFEYSKGATSFQKWKLPSCCREHRVNQDFSASFLAKLSAFISLLGPHFHQTPVRGFPMSDDIKAEGFLLPFSRLSRHLHKAR